MLPDVLKHGLDVVFCGTAVGDTSARVGAYYAGRGNKFWAVLARIKLTPRQLEPHEFRKLPQYGIGLTDLVKATSGTDKSLAESDFDVEAFRKKIEKFAPGAIAFNGKKAAEAFFGRSVDYGRQTEKIRQTVIFVLPSTSGTASRYWDESHWRAMSRFVRTRRKIAAEKDAV